jgi:ribosomal protein L29
MKLKRNDLVELKKAGLIAVTKKIHEYKIAFAEAKLKLKRGESTNLRLTRTLRRALAQMQTIVGQIKE